MENERTERKMKENMGVNESGSYTEGNYTGGSYTGGNYNGSNNPGPESDRDYTAYAYAYEEGGRGFSDSYGHEKSIGAQVFCALLTFFVSLALFGLELALFLSLCLKGLDITSESLISPYENVKIAELKIGSLTNELGIGIRVDKEADVAEYIYANLPEDMKSHTDEETIRQVLDNSDAIEDFFEQNSKKYAAVLNGEADYASITAEDIINVVREHEDEVEQIIGRSVKQRDYIKLDNFLNKYEIEKVTRIDSRPTGANSNRLMFLSGYNYIKNRLWIHCIIGIAVCLIIIAVLNMEEKRRALAKLGICSLLTAGIGFLVMKFMTWGAGIFLKKNSGIRTLFDSLSGNIKNRMVTVVILFAVIGIISVIVYIIINERYIRRENKELVERFNNGGYY